MKRSNRLVALYLALIFVCATGVGILGEHVYNARSVNTKASGARLTPEEWRGRYTREMQGRLNLSLDQLTALNVVLDDTGSKVHDERERHNEAMKSIREEQISKIRTLLTDAQRPEYEKLRHEREVRAKMARNQR